MLGVNKIKKYKKAVSIILLFFCAVFAFVLTWGIVSNFCISNVAYIRTADATIKFELVDEVSLQDDTIEKLSPKIKITSTGATGRLGELIKVTDKNIMFDYTIKNQTHYLSAMGKSLNTTSEHNYRATGGNTSISNSNQLKSFRDKVNNGDSYSGSTITLTADINLNKDEWAPIGNKDRSFNGIFDGSWHCVSNFKITNQEYSGLFGKTNGATISNLKISNLNITNDTTKIGIYAGGLVGQGESSTISSCEISSSVNIKGRYNYSGGIVGGKVAKIENCSSSAVLSINMISPSGYPKANYNMEKYVVCMGGIIGSGNSSNISNCLFDGTLSADGVVTALLIGGIVANIETSITVQNCLSIPMSKFNYNVEFTKSDDWNPISAPHQQKTPMTHAVTGDIFAGVLYTRHTRDYDDDACFIYTYKVATETGNYNVEYWDYPGGVLGIGKEHKEEYKDFTLNSPNHWTI